jgi:hypothetical protein
VGETESTWHVGHCLAYCNSPEWCWWLWSSRWDGWQGKPKYSEKTCPSAALSTTDPTWPNLGSNPGRRGGKSATDCLCYGTAAALLWRASPRLKCISVHYKAQTYKVITTLKAKQQAYVQFIGNACLMSNIKPLCKHDDCVFWCWMGKVAEPNQSFTSCTINFGFLQKCSQHKLLSQLKFYYITDIRSTSGPIYTECSERWQLLRTSY